MRCAIRAGPNKMSGRGSGIWRKMVCGSYGEVDGSAVRGRSSAIQRGGEKRDSGGPLG